MPPKSKKPAPSKASKGRRAPAAAAREPEVLNEHTVATDQHTAEAPVRTKPVKTEASLDELADYLAGASEPMVPLRDAALTVYSGEWNPARELSVLRILKDDERFVIAQGKAGATLVGLVGLQSALDPVPDAEDPSPVADPAPAAGPSEDQAPPAKTLGDHVADAEGRPQHITWTHGIGSGVLLLTEGQAPKKAIIRNIHDHGAFALYDLTIEAGGTIDGLPAHRIGRDIDREGQLADLQMENAALRRHAEKSAELAQKRIQMAAVERQLAEALKKHRDAMEAVVSQLEEHARSEPGQTDLRDVVGEVDEPAAAPKPKRQARMDAPPSPAEDKLNDAPPPADEAHADTALELDDLALTLEDVEEARFEQGTASTGKPQQVTPVRPMDDAEGDLGPYVLVDVQDGCAVLVAVHSKAEWKAEMLATYGKPMALPSDTQTEQLAKGGAWCGMPVKVGRATCWLGDAGAALLVRLPPKQLAAAPEAKAVGKDAAAGG